MSNTTDPHGQSTGCCADQPAAESDCCCKNESSSSCCGGSGGCGGGNLAMTYGAWLLRAWLGVRAVQTGVEKWAGIKGADQRILIDGKPSNYGLSEKDLEKVYDLDQYHGIPTTMLEPFQKEPLLNLKLNILGLKVETASMLPLYDKVLGPVLLALGVAVLLGILPRTTLFLLGLLYVSLTWGLILIAQDAGVAWLGIHIILIVMALAMAKHNRLCLIGKW